MILRGTDSSWGIGERKTPKSPQSPNEYSPKLLNAIYYSRSNDETPNKINKKIKPFFYLTNLNRKFLPVGSSSRTKIAKVYSYKWFPIKLQQRSQHHTNPKGTKRSKSNFQTVPIVCLKNP